jgi:nicotinate-nucleotide pyrophosphorylase (carboxylating)
MTMPPLGSSGSPSPDDLPFGGRVGDQLRARPKPGDGGSGDVGGPAGGLERRGGSRRGGSERRSADRGTADRRAAERRMEGDPDSTLARMLRFGLGTAQPTGLGEAATTAGVPFVQPLDPLYFPLTPAQTSLVVREALTEDEAFNDVTTLATVLSSRHARGRLIARQSGVVAGVLLAVEAFRQLDPRITVRVDVPDGAAVPEGTPVLFMSGHARGILSAERVALNFMQRLSGIASLTAKYVQAVAGTDTRILDTRKTTPGWRRLEKFAVRAGGGHNHRMDLAAAVLIKDNHLAAVDGDVGFAVRRARDVAPPGASVEVECDTRAQVEAALAAGADVILLDNMSLDDLRACAALCKGRAATEASGGVRLDTVRAIAETGVDAISVGALTHSAPAMDLALDFE